MPPSAHTDLETRIVDLREDGLSYREIEQETGASQGKIANVLEAHGLTNGQDANAEDELGPEDVPADPAEAVPQAVHEDQLEQARQQAREQGFENGYEAGKADAKTEFDQDREAAYNAGYEDGYDKAQAELDTASGDTWTDPNGDEWGAPPWEFDCPGCGETIEFYPYDLNRFRACGDCEATLWTGPADRADVQR